MKDLDQIVLETLRVGDIAEFSLGNSLNKGWEVILPAGHHHTQVMSIPRLSLTIALA